MIFYICERYSCHVLPGVLVPVRHRQLQDRGSISKICYICERYSRRCPAWCDCAGKPWPTRSPRSQDMH